MRVLVGVTGAQGVGKSTFCERLRRSLVQKTEIGVTLLSGLGDEVRRRGVPVGTSSNNETIAAIYAAHLRRERTAPADIVLLDRCAVDALAYVRALMVTSDNQTRLFEEISWDLASRLDIIFHLKLSDAFATTIATHESPELRAAIAMHIPKIIVDFTLKAQTLDAADSNAIDEATAAVLDRVGLVYSSEH